MNKGMASSTTRILSVVLILALLVLVSGFASAQPRSVTASFIQLAKLTASDGADVGSSVSISGDTAVVAAYCATVGGSTCQGAAYVFCRDEGGPSAWGQVAKLTASDGAAYDFFGESVSFSGDTAVVGARMADVNGTYDQGAAYVFYRDESGPNAWGQVVKLTAADGAASDFFGASVSVIGDTVVVGAYFADGNGAAYVFYRDEGGPDTWGEVAKLTASDGATEDFFGRSVSVSGDTIVVGARQADISGNSYQGAAYVFYRNQDGPDAWGPVAKLTASDGAAYDSLGESVSVSGDTAVVGAYGADVGSEVDQGAAYVFYRDEGGPDAWGQVAKLTADDGSGYDYFGESVSVSGDTAVVGAYVFHRDQGGADAWGQTTKLTAADCAESDEFGRSVSVSGDTVVVGGIDNDDNGAAYVFIEFEPITWVYLPLVLRSAP